MLALGIEEPKPRRAAVEEILLMAARIFFVVDTVSFCLFTFGAGAGGFHPQDRSADPHLGRQIDFFFLLQ